MPETELPTRRIVVLDGYCLNPGDLSWDGLRQLGALEVHSRSGREDAVPRAQGAEAILVNKTPLGRAELSALPALRYVGVLATGFNIVDTVAARELGIAVTNIPSYGTQSVAQHAIALLLALTNRVAEHVEFSRQGGWSRHPHWSGAQTPLTELAGKTFGVAGFGRIGQQTARIAAAIGMTVKAYDRDMTSGPADFPFTWISLKGLLEESDVVSLHCPLTDDTRGLINAQTLKRMRPGAILLNTSRGPLVDEAALAAALSSGHLAAAGIDVLEEEPPLSGSPLLTAPNCLVTPHIAWATREARGRLLATAVDNLRAWIEGNPRHLIS